MSFWIKLLIIKNIYIIINIIIIIIIVGIIIIIIIIIMMVLFDDAEDVQLIFANHAYLLPEIGKTVVGNLIGQGTTCRRIG